MKTRYRALLHALFAMPLDGGVEARQVQGLLGELGATLGLRVAGQVEVLLNGRSHSVPDLRHGLPPGEVAALRRFLAAAGIDPARDYPI